jgi:putative cell wall-binding protein
VLGSFLVVALVASGALLALGGGVASAATANWSVVGSPTALAQNTQGNEFITDGVVVPNGSSRGPLAATASGTNVVDLTTDTSLTQGDVGRAISGCGVPAGTYIEAVTDSNTLNTSRPVVAGGCSVTITASITGAAAALHFDVPSWSPGEQIRITLAPDDNGDAGAQCTTNGQPQGVNQSTPQAGNYVGFANIEQYLGTESDDGHGVTPPLVDGAGIPNGPHFTFSQEDFIPCSEANPLGDAGDGSLPLPGNVQPSLADGSWATLVLTFTDSGSNGSVTLGQGVSQAPLPDASGPLLYDVGFGAATGPVHVFVSGIGEIPSNATVVGQTPSANNPPSALTRNTATDQVAGAISEFKITETGNMLPPNDGTRASNPMPVNTFNPITHTLQASAPGAVCLVIDNGQGNSLGFGLGANGWSVTNNAGTSGFSAAAGSAAVLDAGNSIFLPVVSQSNGPATWTTTGLTLSGLARADGPVYAWAYWVQGSVDPETGVVTPPTPGCPSVPQIANNSAYTLGYVQVATIRELANSVFGADAVATAAQAVDHQFDSAKGQCVSNTVGPDFFFGSSIFLARDDLYNDGLGAAYAAGTVNSGVLLTPTNSLAPLTATQIRLQGVSTVFVAGGPLAISDAVVDQLDNTVAYQCGGTQPRIDPLTGEPQTLNVIRVYGQTAYDTNERLAEFVGAEPPAAFGPFAAGGAFNSTSGMSTAGPTPGGPVNTALLVTGENFQDAMVASVPAYGGDFISPIGTTGPMPLIATTPGSLSPQAVNAIFNQHIGQVLVIGGPLAVSDNVMNQLAALGVYSVRIAGIDNTETSTQLASFELSPSLGMGYLNWDFDWDAYVNRTAGNINFNQNGQISARVVLMTRGDYFADAMSAAAVLSVHNGRFTNPQKFPLIATVNPSTLGPAVTAFLTGASTPVSSLTGQLPADGRDDQPGISFPAGDDCNNRSSSVFTIQPIGGPVALTPGLLQQAVGLIGSTTQAPIPGISLGCGEINEVEPAG